MAQRRVSATPKNLSPSIGAFAELIHEKYEDLVDIVIDGGYGDNIPSTIVDCTTGDFDIVREGKGDLELYL